MATPSSPASRATPDRSHVPLRPTKLNFSPASQDPLHPNNPNPIYGLKYPNRQALREEPRMITNVDVIYASPILQDHIHHLLADHALDEKKTRQTLRYLGIRDRIFFDYIRLNYPRHYWVYLGDKKMKHFPYKN